MRRSFLPDRRGIAAVEFAFAFPVLVALMMGIFEFANAITAERRLETVAKSIGQMVSQQAPTPTNPTGAITYVGAQTAMNSTMVLFPTVLADSYAKQISWSNDISVTVSSVVFTPTVAGCVSNCAYNAHVAWSAGSARRPCDVGGTPQLTPVADTSAVTPTTLPTDAFGPVSQIVVDIAYDYRPLLWSAAFPPFTIKRSAFIRPRNIPPTSYIPYSVVAGDTGIATKCQGY